MSCSAPARISLDDAARLVDKHGQTYIRKRTVAVAELLDTVAVTVLGIYYQVALGQEFIGYEYGLVEISSRVPAQVEDEFCHALAAQRRYGAHQFGIRRAGELRKLYVSDMVGDHERGLDALQRNGVAHDRHVHKVGDTLTFERELHLCTAAAAQAVYDFVLRDLAAGHDRVVDADYAVAGTHPGLVARTRRNDVQDDNRVGSHVEDNADAVELAFERFVHLLHLRSGDIDRMRVEFLHDDRHHVLDNRVE